MTHTLHSVRARTVESNHQVVLVDDQGAEHIFTASMSGMALIKALDTASVGIELGDTETAQIARNIFDRILTDIKTWTVLDPEYAYTNRPAADQPAGAVVDHDEIHAVRVTVTGFDNGYFPSGELAYFRQGGTLLITEENEDNNFGVVPLVDDGQLGAELKELGGNYRHDSDWTLVITRDGQYGDLDNYTV